MPNALTAGRLVLAGVFFVLLSYYQYTGRGDPLLLNFAFIIYCVALATDFFDGFLARRWKVEGAFGRVVDPFVDKVLVIGSFIFFAGKNFIIPGSEFDPHAHGMVVRTITGVAPGMVVLILARELLVTSFRGLSEGGGQSFGAALSGKVKMVFQSVTILVILVYVNYLHLFREHASLKLFADALRDICIWSTVGITVISGLLYARRALDVYQRGPRSEPGPASRPLV